MTAMLRRQVVTLRDLVQARYRLSTVSVFLLVQFLRRVSALVLCQVC